MILVSKNIKYMRVSVEICRPCRQKHMNIQWLFVAASDDY